MYGKLKELYGTDLAEEYLRQLEDHEIYRHDETAVDRQTLLRQP